MVPAPYFLALQGSRFVFAFNDTLRVCHLQSPSPPDGLPETYRFGYQEQILRLLDARRSTSLRKSSRRRPGKVSFG
jgi:hypothetical protein